MQDLGAKVIKESTKTHFRRKLETCLLSQKTYLEVFAG